MATINNTTPETLITGTDGNDTVKNFGRYVTISTGDGNDNIQNGWAASKQVGGSNVTINSGAGNDHVDNYYGSYSTINTGEGNDYVYNWNGSSDVIYTGAGNDYVYIWKGRYHTINAGDGDDTIRMESNDATISSTGKKVPNVQDFTIIYTEGDGNDYINGFHHDSTLSIAGSSYYTTKSDKYTTIVTVGRGRITLVATSEGGINIDFKEIEMDSWKLSGTTATYGDKITITGVKSLDGISLSGTTVTIAASALNKSKVTISDGYTLAIADDVTKPSTKKAWSLSGTTATYKQTTTTGYKLASDAKSISYTKAATSTLATVKGVKSLDGISLSGKVVTVSKSALNASKVTLSGTGYTLALDSDVTKPSTKKAWSYSNSVATYKQTTSAGYKLASDGKSISYSKKATKTLATIKGAKKKSGFTLSGKTIKLATASLSKKVSVSGSYAFEFASTYQNGMITGSSSNDTIINNGSDVTIRGGKGNDTLTGGSGADVFVYVSGDGNDVITNFDAADRISIASGTANISESGNDVIFTVDTGTITLKDSKGKTIKYFNDDGTERTYSGKSNDVTYSKSGKLATLKDTYDNDSFEANSSVVTINAVAVEQSLEIIGNKKANRITGTEEDDTIYGGAGKDTIYGGDGNDELYGEAGNDKLYGGAGDDSLWGGAGADTLTGGAGSDIFYYKDGDGNDVINDFNSSLDRIVVSASNIGLPKASNDDVTFTVGNGKIVIKGGADKFIQLYGENGGELARRYEPNS